MVLLKHIVFIKSIEDISDDIKKKFFYQLTIKLEKLKSLIPEIRHLEVGQNISTRESAYDLALYVEFDNKKDLEIYSKHPEHILVLEYMKTIKLSLAVVDYFK